MMDPVGKTFNPWTGKWMTLEETQALQADIAHGGLPFGSAGSQHEVFNEEAKSEGFVGGRGNYGGMAVAALPTVEIKPTTPIVPVEGKFTNLDIAGDAVFHGKVSFMTAVHTEWYDASKPVGTDIVIDLSNGPNQYVVLGENKKIWIPSKPDDELMFSIIVMQDHTVCYTVDWEINGGDQETDGMPIVYWPGGEEPVMTATIDAVDMYSLTWMAFLNDGKGAYVGMTTQDMRVPEVPA
jgi:hypothetical protein